MWYERRTPVRNVHDIPCACVRREVNVLLRDIRKNRGGMRHKEDYVDMTERAKDRSQILTYELIRMNDSNVKADVRKYSIGENVAGRLMTVEDVIQIIDN